MSRMVLLTTIILTLSIGVGAIFVPDHILRISVGTTQQDCQPRISTLINGSYPAPPIYLDPDVTTWIRVYNDADVNATIHWHGLSLASAPYADGAPQASQWPIPPGRFFDYELHPRAHEAGTSFYHSHVGFQAITAVGALIVKDAGPPPYRYDDDLILILGDYYPAQDHEIEAQLTGRPWSWPGDPAALLINGHSGRRGTVDYTGWTDDSCQPAYLRVAPNRTYRVRLISATAISLVVLGIEGHENLTIIETDNSYVHPVETWYMQSDTGQRFSFLLETKSKEELGALDGRRQFWIQAETREGDTRTLAWAALSYSSLGETKEQNLTGSNTSPPLTESHENLGPVPEASVLVFPDDVTTWLEYTFTNPALPGYGTPPTSEEVTRRITISTLQLLNETSGYTEMKNNNESWHDAYPTGSTAPIPYLVEILSNGTINGAEPDYGRAQANLEQRGYDPVTHSYPARIGEVIEIIWQNAASYPGGVFGPHPLHAHGGPYWDMGSGPGIYTSAAHQVLLDGSSSWVDGGRPWPGSRRDTTVLYRYQATAAPGEWNGWRVWRTRVTAENVGVWMMHCHILQHVIMGQSIVWVFGSAEEIREHTQPVQGVLDGYLTYGGNVMGKEGEEEGVARARARYFG